MTKERYEECKALLNCWFEVEEQEFGEQGAFNRARWAIKQLAEDLGLSVSDKLPPKAENKDEQSNLQR